MDSVIISRVSDSRRVSVYSNVQPINNKIAVKLKEGFYIVTLKAKGLEFGKSDYVTICSLCDNKVNVRFLDTKDDNVILSGVMISPTYKTGRNGLRQDFQTALTTKELNKLRRLEAFSITMYLTKTYQLSDISINGKGLTKRSKELIIKGLKALTQWKLATLNGRDGDGQISIKSTDII